MGVLKPDLPEELTDKYEDKDVSGLAVNCNTQQSQFAELNHRLSEILVKTKSNGFDSVDSDMEEILEITQQAIDIGKELAHNLMLYSKDVERVSNNVKNRAEQLVLLNMLAEAHLGKI